MTDKLVIPEIEMKRDGANLRGPEFDRDMWRLKELRNKFDSPGLNSYEDSEVNTLLDKWDIERAPMWSRREMFTD